MRRMRDLPWRNITLTVAAIAAAAGVQYYIRFHYPLTGEGEFSVSMKPSYFRPDSAAGTNYANVRNYTRPAGNLNQGRSWFASLFGSEDENLGLSTAGYKSAKSAKSSREIAPEDFDEDSHLDGDTSDLAQLDQIGENEKRYPSALLDGDSVVQGGDPEAKGSGFDPKSGACRSIEYRGDGLKFAKVDPQDWAQVEASFKGAQAGLIAWLNSHRKEFHDNTLATMENQVKSLNVELASAKNDPDLSWRGVGVYTRAQGGAPVLRLGQGFVKLVLKDPSRAKFEMTRLVAQAWAPCEILRAGGQDAWSPLLKCLDLKDESACTNGSYSEAGWAVSSVLATLVAPTSCWVAGLKDDRAVACLKKLPLPLTLSGVASLENSWQEAKK